MALGVFRVMGQLASSRRRTKSALIFAALLGSLSVCPSASYAQSVDANAAAAAQKLFDEGRALMTKGQYEDAIVKLAASQKLDPGAGTLLNLGECYERTTKLASAWATYREAEILAQRAGQKERASYCASKAKALVDNLSVMTVDVPHPVKGLVIRRNETEVVPATYGTAVPVDGGEHLIEATAPNYKPWSKHITVKTSHDRVRVDVPALAALPPKPTAEAARTKPNPLRTVGWIATGVGAATLGTSLVFGFIAKGKNDDANNGHCTTVDCDQRGVDLTRDAKDAATISTVLAIAGGVVAVGGITLVLTTPSTTKVASAPQTKLAIHPSFVSFEASF